MLRRFLNDNSGATAIEYGLIAALISVSILAGYKVIATDLNSQWIDTSKSIEKAGDDYIKK
jgi:pilus assembly protein Flp/PilA